LHAIENKGGGGLLKKTRRYEAFLPLHRRENADTRYRQTKTSGAVRGMPAITVILRRP